MPDTTTPEAATRYVISVSLDQSISSKGAETLFRDFQNFIQSAPLSFQQSVTHLELRQQHQAQMYTHFD